MSFLKFFGINRPSIPSYENRLVTERLIKRSFTMIHQRSKESEIVLQESETIQTYENSPYNSEMIERSEEICSQIEVYILLAEAIEKIISELAKNPTVRNHQATIDLLVNSSLQKEYLKTCVDSIKDITKYLNSVKSGKEDTIKILSSFSYEFQIEALAQIRKIIEIIEIKFENRSIDQQLVRILKLLHNQNLSIERLKEASQCLISIIECLDNFPSLDNLTDKDIIIYFENMVDILEEKLKLIIANSKAKVIRKTRTKILQEGLQVTIELTLRRELIETISEKIKSETDERKSVALQALVARLYNAKTSDEEINQIATLYKTYLGEIQP